MLSEEVQDIAGRLAVVDAEPARAKTVMVQLLLGDGGKAIRVARVSRELGISKLKVRTTWTALCGQAATLRPTAPICLEIMTKIEALLPATELALNTALADRLGPGMTVQGAYLLAKEIVDARLPARPRVRQTGQHRVAIPKEKLPHADAANSRATKLASALGAARMTSLQRAVAKRGFSREQLTRLLEARPGFEFLDEEREWFWFGTSTIRHAFQTNIRKMLSVAREPLSVEQLLVGVERAIALKKAKLEVPPATVARAMLRRLSWVRVDEAGLFSKRAGLAARGGLSDAEDRVYVVLSRLGGSASRRQLMSRLDGALPRDSLLSVIYRSAILAQAPRGEVRLIGWPTPDDDTKEKPPPA